MDSRPTITERRSLQQRTVGGTVAINAKINGRYDFRCQRRLLSLQLYSSSNNHDHPMIKPCPSCKKSYEDKPSRGRTRKHCSALCRVREWRKEQKKP